MKKLSKWAALSLYALCISGSFAADYYVSSTGNDSHSGAENAPWRSIQKAVNQLEAGDHVYIYAGTYKGNVLLKQKSGTSNNWISVDAVPGDEGKVIIDQGSVVIKQSNYIRVSGLRVQNSSSQGFYVEGPGTDITISNNHTYNTFSSGIGVWGVPWKAHPGTYENLFNVKVVNNKVEKANNGGWNECITFANGVVNFEISNNEVFNGGDPTNGGEGIDIKLGMKNGVIAHNQVHGLTRRGIYLDAAGIIEGFPKPYVENVKIYANQVWNNTGQGLAIMTEGEGDVRNVDIYNNVLVNNSEDGIMIYNHPAGSGNVYNIDIYNNTLYGNSRYGMLYTFPGAYGLTFRNNLVYNNGQNIAYKDGAYQASHNLSGVDPLFVNANERNFALQANSPAIDAGTDNGAPSLDILGLQRNMTDIGAYEFRADQSEISPPSSNRKLQLKHSNKCVDLKQGSDANGTPIQQWQCMSDNANQAFALVPIDSAYYEIHTKHNKCLGVSGSSINNGAQLVQWDCVGVNDQQFKLEEIDDDWFRIRPRHSDKCLDVEKVSMENGAVLQQWDCHGGGNQRFRF